MLQRSVMSTKRNNIAELNEIHPLNVLALECLQGYGVNVAEELATLTLIDAWWDELERSKLLKMNGGPRATEVRSALRRLSRADPTDAMAYLAEIDGEPSLDMDELRQLDGNRVARAILEVLIRQLVHAVPLPKPR